MLILYYDYTLSKQVLNRKYIKVQEILANLTDFFKIAIFEIKFITFFFSEFKYCEEMQDILEKKIKNPTLPTTSSSKENRTLS